MKPLKILIVDDEEVMRMSLRWVFRKFDYEIEEAENGKIALDKLRIFQPHVVLLDMGMPVMSGEDFIKSAEPLALQQKIVALTGHVDEQVENKLLSLGAWKVLAKPTNPSVLREIMQSIVLA